MIGVEPAECNQRERPFALHLVPHLSLAAARRELGTSNTARQPGGDAPLSQRVSRPPKPRAIPPSNSRQDGTHSTRPGLAVVSAFAPLSSCKELYFNRRPHLRCLAFAAPMVLQSRGSGSRSSPGGPGLHSSDSMLERRPVDWCEPVGRFGTSERLQPIRSWWYVVLGIAPKHLRVS